VLTPTARLLEFLELLQAKPLITGREISDELGIDPRTVRRYVEALQKLGIRSRVSAASAAAIGSDPATGCRR
jgi:predicted DNA-binding transcriptional regulator YafY